MRQLIKNGIRKIGICSVIGSFIFFPSLLLHEKMIGGSASTEKFEPETYYVAEKIKTESKADTIRYHRVSKFQWHLNLILLDLTLFFGPIAGITVAVFWVKHLYPWIIHRKYENIFEPR